MVFESVDALRCHLGGKKHANNLLAPLSNHVGTGMYNVAELNIMPGILEQNTNKYVKAIG